MTNVVIRDQPAPIALGWPEGEPFAFTVTIDDNGFPADLEADPITAPFGEYAFVVTADGDTATLTAPPAVPAGSYTCRIIWQGASLWAGPVEVFKPGTAGRSMGGDHEATIDRGDHVIQLSVSRGGDVAVVRTVAAGSNLSTARPAGAAAVYWIFDDPLVDVGTGGANIVNAAAGDLWFVPDV